MSRKKSKSRPQHTTHASSSRTTKRTQSGLKRSSRRKNSSIQPGQRWAIAGVAVCVIAMVISSARAFMTLQNDNRLSALEEPQFSVLGAPSTASVQGSTPAGTVAQTDLVALIASSGRQETELIRFRAVETESGRGWTCQRSVAQRTKCQANNENGLSIYSG